MATNWSRFCSANLVEDDEDDLILVFDLNAVVLAEVKELLSKRQSSRSDAELSVDSQDLLTVHQLCQAVSPLAEGSQCGLNCGVRRTTVPPEMQYSRVDV